MKSVVKLGMAHTSDLSPLEVKAGVRLSLGERAGGWGKLPGALAPGGDRCMTRGGGGETWGVSRLPRPPPGCWGGRSVRVTCK